MTLEQDAVAALYAGLAIGACLGALIATITCAVTGVIQMKWPMRRRRQTHLDIWHEYVVTKAEVNRIGRTFIDNNDTSKYTPKEPHA